MDRRKKRTSTNQYMMYIEMMERDPIFASGRVPRDVDVNYLQKKWKELSDKLNSCSSGPNLTAEEWRKRLNDWKNTTRCKYRRSVSGEKDISMTTLEMKALDLFGKAPNVSNVSEQLAIHLKSEKEPVELDEDIEHQQTSETFQKELQAAVEEAIGDEEDDDVLEDPEEQDEILSDPLSAHDQNAIAAGTTTTYRTIVVENAQYTDEANDDHLEFITHRRPIGTTPAPNNVAACGVQTVVTAAPTVYASTKLINGDMPIKRLRSGNTESIIYEVKKTPVPQRLTFNSASTQSQQPQPFQAVDAGNSIGSAIITQDAREIARQLKRIADIKSEKLKFEISRFKFNNPGFQYNYHPPL